MVRHVPVGLPEVPVQNMYKMHRRLIVGRRYVTIQDLVKRGVPAAIESHCIRGVVAYGYAAKIDTGKQAMTARVSKQFGMHAEVCSGLCFTAEGTRCHSGGAANLKAGLQKVLHALLIHGHQHQVGSGAPYLESPSAAGHADKYRSAPAV